MGANGYRYYGREELLRLQQILLHRELGLPLEAIAPLLDDSEHGRIERLREHRQQLMQRTEHYRELIATVDRTIAELEGGPEVDTKQLYSGFSPAKQAGYEAELVERFGEPMRASLEASRRHVKDLGAEGIAARMQELAEIEAALAGHCREQTPAGDPSLDCAAGQAQGVGVRHVGKALPACAMQDWRISTNRIRISGRDMKRWRPDWRTTCRRHARVCELGSGIGMARAAPGFDGHWFQLRERVAAGQPAPAVE